MSPAPADDAYATIDMLVVDDGPTVASHAAGPEVELVAGSRQSLTSATNSLLHARLRAVTVLLLGVSFTILIWILLNWRVDTTGLMHLQMYAAAVRLVVLAAVLL